MDGCRVMPTDRRPLAVAESSVRVHNRPRRTSFRPRNEEKMTVDTRSPITGLVASSGTAMESLTPVDPADLAAPSSTLVSYRGTNISATTGCRQCCCRQSRV